jgi:8-oxo-dGTP pyrophosphatase MutT (NUDIX family)
LEERHFSKENICRQLAEALQRYNRKPQLSQDYFSAAVLIPIIIKDGEPALLFEVRSSNLVWQPGEICFPGGKVEENDEDSIAAAVRETEEELGIDRNCIEIIGQMEPVLSPIGVVLFPAIGFIAGTSELKINKNEVGEVFSVPLTHLIAVEPRIGHMEMATRPAKDFPSELIGGYEVGWKQRKNYAVVFYRYKKYVIWGLTAQVLKNFLDLCRA